MTDPRRDPIAGHMSTIPLARAEYGRLAVEGGTGALEVVARRSSEWLLDASFVGDHPRVQASDGEVVMTYSTGFVAWLRHSLRPRRARLGLNSSIPWWLEFRGGLHGARVDLRDLRVVSIGVRGGVSRGHLWLPQPSGTVRLSISGGVQGVTVHRPPSTPIRISVRGGVSSLTIDGEEVGGIGGGFRRETSGWTGAPDRLDVAIEGGVSDLAVID
jgi:hypothetical protein